MAKVLILGNFELSLELAEDALAGSSDSSVRAKERRILRFLKKLAEEEPGIKGSVEKLELEGFTYSSSNDAEPKGYYYNKYTPDETPKPGEM
ncbi:MAG TPA: hypothetical protein VFF73_04865 [Planctomycetota bacterium]|nr:hypothetical protein [Planctomycetota bacterium]